MREIEKIKKKLLVSIPFLNEKECMVLSYFFVNHDKYKLSRNMEHDLYLRQPEVSLVLSSFCKRQWIEGISNATKKRGRPIILYRLTKPPNAIIGEIIQKIEGEIKKQQQQIKKLRELVEQIV